MPTISHSAPTSNHHRFGADQTGPYGKLMQGTTTAVTMVATPILLRAPATSLMRSFRIRFIDGLRPLATSRVG